MEAGLRVGLDLAEESGESFEGATRLMLFTDERPNVGATDSGSFMDLARRASKRGIGMTTVGVGVQFGAELASKISSVRGGNLFFFPDANDMVEVFTDEFDTMVTELAYDFSLVMVPRSGLRIAGVYGIPRDQLRWQDGRAISLSHRDDFPEQGGRAPSILPWRGRTRATCRGEGGMPGDRLAVCDLRYTPVDGDAAVELATGIALMEGEEVGKGLCRGEFLINEYTMLKRAATLHLVENDQEGAYRMVDRLRSLSPRNDPDLDIEYELIDKMYATLALLSGPRRRGPFGISFDASRAALLGSMECRKGHRSRGFRKSRFLARWRHPGSVQAQGRLVRRRRVGLAFRRRRDVH